MIAFQRVKKSLLIIGIVDRIKIILIVSSYFHSASPSCPILSANCRYNLRQVRLFRGDSSDFWGMDKSSSATCLLYGKRTKKKPWRKRQSRSSSRSPSVRDFRFINILQLFSIYFFFELLYVITFFFHTFFLPTKFTHTHTHDPRPLPTTLDPRHLATLDKCGHTTMASQTWQKWYEF